MDTLAWLMIEVVIFPFEHEGKGLGKFFESPDIDFCFLSTLQPR